MTTHYCAAELKQLQHAVDSICDEQVEEEGGEKVLLRVGSGRPGLYLVE